MRVPLIYGPLWAPVLLVEEYEVTPEKALSDADTLIEVWRKQGVIEE